MDDTFIYYVTSLQQICIECHSIIAPSQASVPFHAHVSSQATAPSKAGPCPSLTLAPIQGSCTLPCSYTLPGPSTSLVHVSCHTFAPPCSCLLPGRCPLSACTPRLFYLLRRLHPPRCMPPLRFLTLPCSYTLPGSCPIPGLVELPPPTLRLLHLGSFLLQGCCVPTRLPHPRLHPMPLSRYPPIPRLLPLPDSYTLPGS